MQQKETEGTETASGEWPVISSHEPLLENLEAGRHRSRAISPVISW